MLFRSPTTTVRPDDPARDADDPGRPALRRGRPTPRATASGDAAPIEPAAAPSASVATPGAPQLSGSVPQPAAQTQPDVIPVQEDPIIVKAREAAAAYVGSLPNFLVRQVTTRYDSDNPKSGWQAHDTVTADVTYEDRKSTRLNSSHT